MTKLQFLRKLPIAAHTVAWMIIGAIAGAEAVFFASGGQGIVVVFLALMNYALFTVIWGIGFGMGAWQEHEAQELRKKNDGTIHEAHQS
jgi:hypothetical protein